MKKFFSLILSFVFTTVLTFPVFAAETHPLVVDNAGILTETEIYALEEMAQAIRQEYEIDAAILTIDHLHGQSAQAYADNFYDQHGYGYGENADGLIFLLSMEEREWYISTSGKVIYALTDYGIQELADHSFSALDEHGFYGVFYTFLLNLTPYLDAYEAGSPIDGYANYANDYIRGQQEEIVYYAKDPSPNLLISIIIGLLTATVVIFIMRSSMNTKRPQHSAVNYMKSGSFHLRSRQDMFLYSNVSKIRRQQNNSNSGRGGSSVHRSSSGRSHGGGGGRF